MQDLSCQNCEKRFRDYLSNNRKFCSQLCKSQSQVMDKTTECAWCYKIFKTVRGKYCSSKCFSEFNSNRMTNNKPWNKGKKFIQISGKKHWNWKGGNKRGKRGAEQRRFRLAVLKRDNYTCVLCGSADKQLIADHIKPYFLYPELREDIDNGRTLCKDCNYESTYIKKEWSLV